MGGDGANRAAEPQDDVVVAEMKPWEQHSAFIALPRFDYGAPSSLLDRPHSGFLVTCPIKREKSATKEAISIFKKFLEENDKWCGIFDSEPDLKKRKMCTKDECSVGPKQDAFVDARSCASSEPCVDISTENGERKDNLSLVKLKKNGLLLFTFLSDEQNCAVNVLAKILASLESGELKRPEWCFRIFPIQETCIMQQQNLYRVVSKLVQVFVNDVCNNLGKPIKFAICYDRRGVDEAINKTPKPVAADGIGADNLDLFDRDTCFRVVAEAVKEVVKDSVVDLKSPELIVRIELLPISGLPADSLVAGVSVLPKEFLSIKSRGICMKALVADTNSNK